VSLVRGGRAEARHSPFATKVFCPSEEPMLLVRADVLVVRDGRWRSDDFGFGRTECMPADGQ